MSIWFLLAVIVFSWLSSSRSFGEEPTLETEAKSDASVGFALLGKEETGIDFVSRLVADHPLSYLYHSGMTCSGIAAGDVDGDGRPDLYVANGPGKNVLYLQTDTAFKFEDYTAAAGVGLDGGDEWAAGVAFADVDNDGDLDIYVCNYEAPNQLFLNLGKGEGKRVRFRETAELAGINVVDSSQTASFCDYDNDGDLDFYLLCNRVEDPRGTLSKLPVEFERPGVPKLLPGYERYHSIWIVDADNWGVEASGRPDYLFRNDGVDENGQVSFTDVTTVSGISGRGDGLSSVWWDADMDGDSDLYVCNDFISPDRFYVNNGDGTFTNQVAESMPHTTWFSMGSDFGDLDNDGDLDLLVADMSATSHYKSKVTMGIMGGITLQRANDSNPPQYMRNALYVNEGNRVFREGANLAGLSSSDWTWAIKINDYDADGLLDVFMTNGVAREMNHSDIQVNREMLVGKHMWDLFKEGDLRREQNRVFKNTGGLKFKDVSKNWGLDHVGASYGAACADFDQDGDIDIVMVNLEENVFVYRNDLDSGNQITIALEGSESNRFGVGAVVTVESGSQRWTRQLMPSTGYHSYDEPVLHFGMGDVSKIDKISVRWPSGEIQVVTDVALDGLSRGNRLTIAESDKVEADGPDSAVAKAGEPWLKVSSGLEDLWYQENEFNDFGLQPLLPHRLASEGPCMAWGDVDGDGREDVFLGGSAGNAAELRLSLGDGAFKSSNARVFFKERKGEDASAAFADVDGDGDLDLLVGRGSYEFSSGDELQRNLLFLNDGKGNFQKGPSNLLPESAFNSGTIAFCDIDQDGDEDVFVGTRVKSGSYPQSESSELWINEGGRFVEKTSALAEGLGKLGMVTDASWADINGDGWKDLVVAREWDSIGVFLNEKGKLVQSNGGELTERTGWWSALSVGDLNGDGHTDIVASNIGLNTKYKTSVKKPMAVYFGDFDESGKPHIVEVKHEGDVCYPERGRSCSSNAMPFISKKFETFHEFGMASLTDIYGEEKLGSAEKYEANTFEHAVFLNDGKGKFKFKALPRIAQISPSKAVDIGDLDADGDLDIVLGQNFFGPQSETGRYDGGLGQILINDGQGGFVAEKPAATGFVVREAATSIVVRDLDRDGQVDIAVGTNDGPVRLFHTQKR